MDTIGQAVATVKRQLGGGLLRRCRALPMTGRGSPTDEDPHAGLIKRPLPNGSIGPPVWQRIKPSLLDRLRNAAAGGERWPLYIYGDTGTGKTYAVIWLLNQVPTSAYLSNDTLREEAYRPESLVWHIARDWTLVAVDEVGTVSEAEDKYKWSRERDAVKRLADIRDGMPTIWLSNKPATDIAGLYGPRIHSRICSGTVLHLDGPDRRFE